MTSEPKSPDAPRKRRSGFKKWLLRQVVERSPVVRRELLDEAMRNRFVPPGTLGFTMMRVALLRLEAQGLVTFDRQRAFWTGKAPKVKYVGDATWRRLKKLANGDRALFLQMQADEIARLQAERVALYRSLRPPGAPDAFPDSVPPRRARRTPPPKSTRLQHLLSELSSDRISSSLAAYEKANYP